MGQNTISNIMKSMASCLMTNHSMRKTLMSKLKKSGQPCNAICEITGHARESLLDDYDQIDENQRKELSHIISGYKEVPKKILQTTTPTKTLQTKPQIKWLQSNPNEHHWFLFVTSNNKA